MAETNKEKMFKQALRMTVMKNLETHVHTLLFEHSLFPASRLISLAAMPSQCPEVNKTEADQRYWPHCWNQAMSHPMIFPSPWQKAMFLMLSCSRALSIRLQFLIFKTINTFVVVSEDSNLPDFMYLYAWNYQKNRYVL